jgi:AcrR family transcriptional regulator
MSAPKNRSARPQAQAASAVKQQRKRLSPELRRAQILEAAAGLVLDQGFLPLPIERLAREAGSSKALIYAYFPTQYDLFNALFERELNDLATAGLMTASRVNDLEQAAVLCSMLYFEHIARRGPLLQIISNDLYMAGHTDDKLVRECIALRRRLAGLVHTSMGLPVREADAAVEMLMAIPTESGSLVFSKAVSPRVSREVCHALILSSLQALREPERLPVLPAQQSA